MRDKDGGSPNNDANNKDKKSSKRCILCGCPDHRLFGCAKHFAGKCSCARKHQNN